MIEKKLVQLYASGAGVGLDVAEREVVLTYVLRLLSDSGFSDRLAFKGGTAIRKLHLGRTGRFSLDLDFTALGDVDPETVVLDVVTLLDGRIFHGITFSILQPDYWVTEDSCGAEVNYRHSWVDSARFGIQVSCRARPLLPARLANLLHEPYFKWMGIDPPRVLALDPHEIIGEKIRAAVQRARVRDVFDLYQFADRPYDRGTVRRVAVMKCWETRYAFDPVAFLDTLTSRRYDWADLGRLVRGADLPRPDHMVRSIQGAYGFLKDLSAEEARLAQDPYGRELQLHDRLVEDLRSKFA